MTFAEQAGQIIANKSREEQFSGVVLVKQGENELFRAAYGYANFFLLDDAGQVVRWGHTGEEDGVSCRLCYYPKENLDVVILGN